MESITTDPGTDTGTENTADAAALVPDSTGGASPAQDSASAANPTGDDTGSLKTGAETPPNQTTPQPAAAATAPPPTDWKKAYDGQYQATQRFQKELKAREQAIADMDRQLKELRTQYDGIDPREAQEIRQQRQSAQLPPWDPRSQAKPDFDQLLATAQHYAQMQARARTPEELAFVEAQYHADVNPQQHQVLEAFKRQGQQETLRMQRNPNAWAHELVLPLIQQELQKFQQQTAGSYQQHMSVRQELDQILAKNPELNNRETFARVEELINAGYPMKGAYAVIRAEMLESKVSGAELAQKSAEAKEKLLQGNASISRDPATTPSIDLFAEARRIAKEKGITNPFDKRHLGILDDLRKKHNIKG